MLASCTPATKWGIRLNDDSTVDFVYCYGTPKEVNVDYGFTGNDANQVEWQGISEITLQTAHVIHYGDERYVSSVLMPPPPDWDWVSIGLNEVSRSNLTEGEWLWFTSDFPWVPNVACAKVPADELEK